MWKADLGAINSTVPHTLDEGEVVGILGVEDDLIDYLLQIWRSVNIMSKFEETYLDVVHLKECIWSEGWFNPGA